MLPSALVYHLKGLWITTFDQIAHPEGTSVFVQVWKYATLLGLPEQWHDHWHDFINSLSESHRQMTNSFGKMPQAADTL